MEPAAKSNGTDGELSEALDRADAAVSRALADRQWAMDVRPVGQIHYVGNGIARAGALRGLKSEELVGFSREGYGLVFDLSRRETGIILLDDIPDLRAGDEMRPTGRVLEVPVGEKLIGRIVDPKGLPLDNRGAIPAEKWALVEKPAPGIMDRSPVTVPLQTGLKVIDALIPIGRGQRELILGDRQTGKTAVALDTIINQKGRDVVCIYCAIGKRGSAVAKVVEDLKSHQAMDYTFLVFTSEESPPGLQYIAPYAATSMGEYFMEQGQDVLIVYDDLTRHARAYRELSLLLRRPPGREAYPGDIFYIHSRLLERSTHLKDALGGGSMTALPIVETEAQNISAYIPTNLISITDGQVYLSPDLFQKGILPPVDVGKSVSRVGGKTQLPAYRAVAGDLRLSYSQFEELESFARFGTRMDDDTKATLEHGQRVREILKQPQYQPLSVVEQVAVLVAANQGLLDQLDVGEVGRAEDRIREAARRDLDDIRDQIMSGKKIGPEAIETISRTARAAIRE